MYQKYELRYVQCNLVEVVYKNGVRDTKKYKSKDWI